MQLYTCCPNDTCGAFQKALNWLQSQGIEPSMEFDGGHHFFEFHFPEDWDTEQRIEFKWELAQMTSGGVLCRCERWLEEGASGNVDQRTCPSCSQEYLFCQECDALEQWLGCVCRRDEQ